MQCIFKCIHILNYKLYSIIGIKIIQSTTVFNKTDCENVYLFTVYKQTVQEETGKISRGMKIWLVTADFMKL